MRLTCAGFLTGVLALTRAFAPDPMPPRPPDAETLCHGSEYTAKGLKPCGQYGYPGNPYCCCGCHPGDGSTCDCCTGENTEGAIYWGTEGKEMPMYGPEDMRDAYAYSEGGEWPLMVGCVDD